jgi:hypothetical protein
MKRLILLLLASCAYSQQVYSTENTSREPDSVAKFINNSSQTLRCYIRGYLQTRTVEIAAGKEMVVKKRRHFLKKQFPKVEIEPASSVAVRAELSGSTSAVDELWRTNSKRAVNLNLYPNNPVITLNDIAAIVVSEPAAIAPSADLGIDVNTVLEDPTVVSE